MIENKTERIYEDMVSIYQRIFTDADLEHVLRSQKWPIMRFKHIVRGKLKEKYNATLDMIAEAEGRITGKVVDHSTIINSLEKLQMLEKESVTDAILRKDIQDIELFIHILHGRSPSASKDIKTWLMQYQKEDIVQMCCRLIGWNILSRAMIDAAMYDVIEEQQLPQSTGKHEPSKV